MKYILERESRANAVPGATGLRLESSRRGTLLSSFELITVVQLINVVSSAAFEFGCNLSLPLPRGSPLNDDIIERLIFHAITT